MDWRALSELLAAARGCWWVSRAHHTQPALPSQQQRQTGLPDLCLPSLHRHLRSTSQQFSQHLGSRGESPHEVLAMKLQQQDQTGVSSPAPAKNASPPAANDTMSEAMHAIRDRSHVRTRCLRLGHWAPLWRRSLIVAINTAGRELESHPRNRSFHYFRRLTCITKWQIATSTAH